MTNGATIQFTIMLKTTCFHNARSCKILCSVSNRILHRMGYIITSSPIAVTI